MNNILRNTIVKHIFSNFGVIQSKFIDSNKTKSLMSNEFLLSKKISYKNTAGNIVKNNVWGCQITLDQKEFKILLADYGQDSSKEYCLLVQLKNSPAYGLYILNDEILGDETMIACTLDGKQWMECQTFLQATFLAGMEQIKDIGLSWSKCNSYREQFDLILSFIEFYESIYEAKYAGQED